MKLKILPLLLTLLTIRSLAVSSLQNFLAEQRQISHVRITHTSVILYSVSHNFHSAISDGSLPSRYYHFKHAGIGLLATGTVLTITGITFIGLALTPQHLSDPYAIGYTAYLAPGIIVLCASVFFTIPGAILLAQAKKIKRQNIALYPTLSKTDLAMVRPTSLAPGLTLRLKF